VRRVVAIAIAWARGASGVSIVSSVMRNLLGLEAV